MWIGHLLHTSASIEFLLVYSQNGHEDSMSPYSFHLGHLNLQDEPVSANQVHNSMQISLAFFLVSLYLCHYSPTKCSLIDISFGFLKSYVWQSKQSAPLWHISQVPMECPIFISHLIPQLELLLRHLRVAQQSLQINILILLSMWKYIKVKCYEWRNSN